jgi:hypothetical protein
MKKISFALKDIASWETDRHFVENYLACEALFSIENE